MGFPSPPAALPPPPPAPEIKPPGPRSRGLPPGPPARAPGCSVRTVCRVEWEQSGHELRRLGNVLWRKKARGPAGFACPLQVGSRLAVSLNVSVRTSLGSSACCQSCVTVVCAPACHYRRVVRVVQDGWAKAGVEAWLRLRLRSADLWRHLGDRLTFDCLFRPTPQSSC